MKFNAVKIGSQLQIGFGVIMFLIVVLGALSLQQTDKIAQQTSDLYQHPLQVRQALGQLNNDILAMRLEGSNFLHAVDEADREEAIKKIETLHDNAEAQFIVLGERYLGSKSDIEEASIAFEQWFNKLEDLKLLKAKAISEEAIREILLSDDYSGKPILLLKAISKIDNFAKAKGNELFQTATDLNQTLKWQMVTIVLVILIFSMVIVFYLIHNIRQPLKLISEAARHFREGKTQARCAYVENNEFGELSVAFNDLAGTIETELNLNKQSAKLAEIMLNENEADGFCHSLLAALIEYTGAQLGAIYLLNDSKTFFEKFVGIGLEEKACKPFSANNFEGEFGLALATRKIQYITDIPADTQLKFSTVSGNYTPREIFTIPIFIGNEIVAVISLATIKLFSVISLPLLYKIQSMLNARMDGILTWQKVAAFSKQLEIQNLELETQKNELSVHSNELAAQNRELEMQKRQLDEANKMKTSFLSSMSHELRTPLNSVIALSGVLNRRLEGKIGKDEYSYLEVIERNGKQLLMLINDILDLSRIEAGREVVEINRFNIRELIHEVFESIEPVANQRNISISYQIDSNLSFIESDSDKIRHIVQNIVSNAVKFTEEGSVVILVEQKGGSISILVSDTGIGIKQDLLPHIFDEFIQADGSNSRKYGGTGLGLAIAKKYANMLGGNITVESTLKQGSKFTLLLPFRIPHFHFKREPEVNPVHELSNQKGSENTQKTILLVEDNSAIIVQMRDILELQGYQIMEAHNGQEALEQISNQIPDAMILDLMMPGVDGFEVLKRIREEKKTEYLPVIILTAKIVTKEELAFLKHNGIHQLIRKGDINKDQLLKEIASMLRVDSRVEKPNPNFMVKQAESSVPKILVVEDNPDNMLTIKALIDNRWAVVEAGDGRKGFEIAITHMPDLILIDIALPELSGIEVLKLIRKEQAIRHTPVIAVSASAMKGDHERFIAQGFNDYLSKPIDRELFENMIRKYIKD